MQNPYAAPKSQPTTSSRLGIVVALCFGVLALVVCGLVAIPGVVVLNQNFQFVPTDTFLSGAEIGSVTLDEQSLLSWSLGIAVLFLFASVTQFWKAFRRWRSFEERRQLRDQMLS
ncbi:hypothetical protein C2E31_10095 [Rhodopirellula baltica]|nr:hypothetical protein C2E31_10095 [Rhodopirellula baltica]